MVRFRGHRGVIVRIFLCGSYLQDFLFLRGSDEASMSRRVCTLAVRIAEAWSGFGKGLSGFWRVRAIFGGSGQDLGPLRRRGPLIVRILESSAGFWKEWSGFGKEWLGFWNEWSGFRYFTGSSSGYLVFLAAIFRILWVSGGKLHEL